MSLSRCAFLPTLVSCPSLLFFFSLLLRWRTFVTSPHRLLAVKDLQAIPQTDQKKRGEPLGLETSCTKKALDEFAGQPAEGESQGFSVGAQGWFSCGPGMARDQEWELLLGEAGSCRADLSLPLQPFQPTDAPKP